MIKHENSKWVLYSKDGTKKLGEFDSEYEAKEREKEINILKHKKESFTDSIYSFALMESKDSDGAEWDVVLIAAGESDNTGGTGNKRFYPAETLKKAVGLFENAHAMAYKFVGKIQDLFDHEKSTRETKPDGLAANQVGFFRNVHFGKFKDSKGQEREGILARFHVLEGAKWLRDNLLDAWKHGKQILGFSIDAEGEETPLKVGDKLYDAVTNISRVLENTVVTRPAAGGQVIRLVASQNEHLTKESNKMNREEIIKLLKEKAAHLLKDKDVDKISESDLLLLLAEALTKKEEPKPEVTVAPVVPTVAPVVSKVDDTKVNESMKKFTEAEGKITESLRKLEIKEAKINFKTKLSESSLPNPIKAKLEKQYAEIVLNDEQVDTLLAQEQDAYAKLTESMPKTHVAMGSDERDKLELAMDGFWSGKDEVDKDGKKVKAFVSFKEAYATIVRDPAAVYADPSLVLFDSYFFMPQMETASFVESYNQKRRAALMESARMTEALKTSDWAEILGNTLNRAMMKEFNTDQYQEWRKLVSNTTPVSDFRAQRRLKMGGYGILSTVSEQATYQPLTSAGDTEVTYTPAKKGGLESITMEMVANDDVGSIRMIPKKLGLAAITTIYYDIFNMFTNNLESDGTTTLASAARGNCSGGATALSSAGLDTAVTLMRSQTVYGNTSYQHVGMAFSPKYLLVSPTLEALAKRLFMSDILVGTGGAAAGTTSDAMSTEPNIWKNMFEPLVIPYWTTGTNWWVVADPRLAPTIEVGFFRGRQEPELFVQDNPTVGSVFTADKITYKIRFIYGYNVLEYRSLYYSY